MVKLKKLKFPKIKKYYRFHVSLNKNLFLLMNKPIAYNVKIKDDIVQYDTSYQGIKKLRNEEFYDEVKVVDNSKNFIERIVKNHLLLTVSVVIIFFLFFTSSLFIRDIEFQNQNNYDYDVHMFVAQHIKRWGPFYKLDCKLNDLGNDLRTTFPHYAYVGVQKIGAKLVIEIEKQNIPIIDQVDERYSGDVIANFDGYITGIEVKKGVLCVITSQSVKKGDLLISGNLDYRTNPTSTEHYTHASGIIIASVATYEKIIVPKVQTEQRYTGNQHSNYVINLFGRDLIIGKRTSINTGYNILNNIFVFKPFISFYKVTSYEINNVEIRYTEETALKYAISKIKYDFSLGIVTDEEKINSIDLILTREEPTFFEFTFLVKSIRNIGTFKKINISSNSN